jgi:hypothetical protein
VRVEEVMRKQIDGIAIAVSEPYPCWISIDFPRPLLGVQQLRDLRYLIDWAIATAEEKERGKP